MTTPVSVSVRDGIAVLQLERPDRLNALDPEMATALDVALSEIASDESIRCVQVQGAGPAFMAGGDLVYFKQVLGQSKTRTPELLDPVFDRIHGAVSTLKSMPQPVLARVHGAVAGFGMSLMMACDLVVAAASAQFTLAYCGIGTSPDGGSTFSLPRVVGAKRAMELALLSERFDSARALELGLVNWVVPDDELEDRCSSLMKNLAGGPRLAYAHTKRLINESFDNDLSRQLQLEKSCFIDCFSSPDFEEGITAFLEKRKPRFDS